MKKLFLILVMLVAVNVSGQWVQTNGFSSGYIYSLAQSGNTLFAGTDYIPGLYISTDNGLNWTISSLNNRDVGAITVSSNNIYAGTNVGVFLSTNLGSNWTQTVLNNRFILSLESKGNYVFAGTLDSGVFISSDNGISWFHSSLNSRVISSLSKNDNYVFAGTWGTGVFITTNNGSNWTQTSLNNRWVYSLAVSGNKVYAGTDKGVYLSVNNGSNWVQTSLNNKVIYTLCISGNIVIAGPVQNGVYYSSNNGLNWVQFNQGFSVIPTLYSSLVTNNYIFAGTNGQSVWRRPLSEIIGIQNISTEIPAKYSLSQNYPNPFNPITNIKFTIVNSGDVKLVVYDVMGREVQTLVNESLQPGTYETSFDGSAC